MKARRFGRGAALALIALIFGLGIAVGILGTHLFYAYRLREPGAVSDWVVDAGARQMANRLDLRPDQRRQFDGVMAGTRSDVRALRADIIDRVRHIRQRALEGLLEILDEEQRQELRQIHEHEGRFLDRYLDQPAAPAPDPVAAEPDSPQNGEPR